MVNFKKGCPIQLSYEWSISFTPFANTFCAIQNRYNHVGVSAKAD